MWGNKSVLPTFKLNLWTNIVTLFYLIEPNRQKKRIFVVNVHFWISMQDTSSLRPARIRCISLLVVPRTEPVLQMHMHILKTLPWLWRTTESWNITEVYSFHLKMGLKHMKVNQTNNNTRQGSTVTHTGVWDRASSGRENETQVRKHRWQQSG